MSWQFQPQAPKACQKPLQLFPFHFSNTLFPLWSSSFWFYPSCCAWCLPWCCWDTCCSCCHSAHRSFPLLLKLLSSITTENDLHQFSAGLYMIVHLLFTPGKCCGLLKPSPCIMSCIDGKKCFFSINLHVRYQSASLVTRMKRCFCFFDCLTQMCCPACVLTAVYRAWRTWLCEVQDVWCQT